ncbi:hypothetical protein L211DRAFT_840063 [Terfezia boudieri ATCC MYA-4762]|uniref:Uncharacterized protein n=1 Tax=Terfezia boudieri ATCC MYA-4762 TaxID=1051890 RepID=A0A3N4LGG0_9PEZI|nr:hypothetical protein L211DRAFT_840063 [Terfezia boudieri ATCC MYA-4762]
MDGYSNNPSLEQNATPPQSNLLISGITAMNNISLMAPSIPCAACGSFATTFARYMVGELLDDFENLPFSGSQDNIDDTDLELEQLEYCYTQVTGSIPIVVYGWPDLSHPIFSSPTPKERLLKLRHAIRKLLFLNFFIMKHGAAAIQPEYSLLSTIRYPFGHTFPSNWNARNLVSANSNFLSSLPMEYAQAIPSSEVSLELRPDTVRMDMASRSPPLPPSVQNMQTSALPATALDPKIGTCISKRVPECCDQQPRGNHHYHHRPHTRLRRRGSSTSFFCPLPSCSRNKCTPQKAFRRTDNLRAHLKTVHNLSITDGVWVPRWIAGNTDLLNEAEDRARARLSLASSPSAYF